MRTFINHTHGALKMPQNKPENVAQQKCRKFRQPERGTPDRLWGETAQTPPTNMTRPQRTNTNNRDISNYISFISKAEIISFLHTLRGYPYAQAPCNQLTRLYSPMAL